MKVWQAGILIGLGILTGWLVWGRQTPPPAEPIVEIHTDTLKTRPDTIEVVPPAVIGQISLLRRRLAAFVAETTIVSDTACISLLIAANSVLDSLQVVLAQKPGVKLLLQDSLTAKWPIKALWLAVRYEAAGDSATERWEYRQWPAPLAAKSRLGAVFGYGEGCGGFAGAQVRLDQSKALQVAKSEKGWQGGLVWYIR